MCLDELLETFYSSDEESSISTSEYYRRLFVNAIENFDAYVQQYGTDGANVQFSINIDYTKDTLNEFFMHGDAEYSEMIKARTELEEKIKNSGGISY